MASLKKPLSPGRVLGDAGRRDSVLRLNGTLEIVSGNPLDSHIACAFSGTYFGLGRNQIRSRIPGHGVKSPLSASVIPISGRYGRDGQLSGCAVHDNVEIVGSHLRGRGWRNHRTNYGAVIVQLAKTRSRRRYTGHYREQRDTQYERPFHTNSPFVEASKTAMLDRSLWDGADHLCLDYARHVHV